MTVRILILLLLVFVSCNQTKEFSNNLIQEEVLIDEFNNNVVIVGSTDDPRAFKYLNFLHLSSNSKDKSKSIKYQVENRPDSISYQELNFIESRYIELLSFGTNKFYDLPIFVQPGDSIYVEIRKNEINVTGTSSNHYKLYKEIYKIKYPIFNNDLLIYKGQCLDIYKQHSQLFNDFIIENPEVSDSFIRKTKNRLFMEYYSRIIQLTVEKNGRRIELSDNHFNQISKKYGIETSIKFSDSYFEGLNFKILNDKQLWKTKGYIEVLTSYVHFKYGNILESYSPNHFLQEKNIFINEFTDKAQEIGLANLIIKYYKINPIKNYKNVKVAIEEFKMRHPNSNYMNKVNEVTRLMNKLSKNLSIEMLDEKLISLSGDTLSFSDVLEKSGNRMKVLDIWASWCYPCIQDISIGAKNKGIYAKDYQIDWIYISIDTDLEKWRKKSIELQKYGTLINQYRLLNVQSSALKNKFKINSIPRYIILDKKGYLINDNAPRPVDYISFINSLN